MRQPALLLHDRTIAPSTYDKEAISQWLAEHRWGRNPMVLPILHGVSLQLLMLAAPQQQLPMSAAAHSLAATVLRFITCVTTSAHMRCSAGRFGVTTLKVCIDATPAVLCCAVLCCAVN
jgi:hypothetical protein